MADTQAISGGIDRGVFAPVSLGEALRLLRQRSRYSRDQLAREAGVSGGAISNYENGVSVPPAPTLRQIARALSTALALDVTDVWDELGRILDVEVAAPAKEAATGPQA